MKSFLVIIIISRRPVSPSSVSFFGRLMIANNTYHNRRNGPLSMSADVPGANVTQRSPFGCLSSDARPISFSPAPSTFPSPLPITQCVIYYTTPLL